MAGLWRTWGGVPSSQCCLACARLAGAGLAAVFGLANATPLVAAVHKPAVVHLIPRLGRHDGGGRRWGGECGGVFESGGVHGQEGPTL